MFTHRSLFTIVTLLAASHLPAADLGVYGQTNLVSDIPGLAANTDPNLINPWGVSESGASPFWISDNGGGVSTLYNSAGTPQSLVVKIPNPGGGDSAPTGQVFNSSAGFNGDIFVFATEDGTIAGWRNALGTNAEILFNNSSNGAIYKGLASATVGSSSYLFATDFHNNRIDVFRSTGSPSLPGDFTDATIPAGYAPFNVQNIGNQLYVTYAKQDPNAHDDMPGAGNGFVDVFGLNGNLIRRVASNGPLNSPWGLAVAPSSWGSIAGDLLVGDFGSGDIDIFSQSGDFLGMLNNENGNPIANEGLWTLTFGNNGNGGSANSLYITAGLNGESDGLFARIDPVPEPSTFVLLGLAICLAFVRKHRSAKP